MNTDTILRFPLPRICGRAAAAFIILFACSAAIADVEVTITQVGPDVEYSVTGDLDLSGLSSPASFSSSANQFTHNDGTGLSATATVIASATVLGDAYDLPITAMSPLGTFPGGVNFIPLSVDPLLALGYIDRSTPFVNDLLIVPDGYVSGSSLNAVFVVPGTTIGTMMLTNGDFWGTEFDTGSGVTQSITFNVVPEPQSFLLMIGLALSSIAARIRRSR